MKLSTSLLLFSALVSFPRIAGADPPSHTKTTISVQMRSEYRVLGGENSTGGLSLGAAGHIIQPVAGDQSWSLALYAGIGAGVVGLGGGKDMWYWLGVVAGPEVGAYYRSGWYYGGVGVALPYGQLPFVNDWGWPMRYWGFWPTLDIKPIGARLDDFNVALSVKPMYTNTWSCPNCISWALGVSGGFR